MDQTHFKPIIGTPFRLEISTVQNKPGTWNSMKVSIYRDDAYDIKTNVYRRGTLIGEYLRNYSSYAFETFYPFMVENEWYALYSASYTATRVMKLHTDRIEDWCGEEAHSNGFCPVEFYVPKYVETAHTYKVEGTEEESTYSVYYMDCDCTNEELRTEIESSEFLKSDYCDFAFLCGCVWGDDTSWKIRHIDLSQIPNKILSITEKFGYWEMPNNLKLQQCIRMDGWEPDHPWISLTRAEHINLTTDERC